ncbi:MAG TPA: hypothetical protein VH396_20885 [Chitinophagaceae bacterium]|jgi:hypothetical protein
MQTDIVKQEILLIIDTFSKKELCEKNGSQSYCHQSFAKQLEEACWNGLLDEMLIGIVQELSSQKRLCLWQIQQSKSFLQIELCNYPHKVEKHLSINPYVFLSTAIQN